MSVTVTLIGKDAETVKADGQKLFGTTVTSSIQNVVPSVSNGATVTNIPEGLNGLSLAQIVENQEGKLKVMYDQIAALQDKANKPVAQRPIIVNPVSPSPISQDEVDNINTELDQMRTNYATVLDALKSGDATNAQQDTELHEMATHINELTADKMNKDLGVQSKLYQIIRIDTPDPNPDAISNNPVIPGPLNHIGIWHMKQMVNLQPLDNNAHLWFIIVQNIAYPLPILKYNPNSDPVRLGKVLVPIGLKPDGLVFSATGENAQLQMFVNTNPDDVGFIQLIKFF